MDRYSNSGRDSHSNTHRNHTHSRHTSDHSRHNPPSNPPSNETSTLDRPTHHTRRGAVSHTLPTSLNESNHTQSQRNPHHQPPHHRSPAPAHSKNNKFEIDTKPRRRSPITLVYDLQDPEFGWQDNSSCGYAIRRPDPRFGGGTADDDVDEDVSPRSKVGVRRATGKYGRGRMGLIASEVEEGDGGKGVRGSRGHGSGGRDGETRGGMRERRRRGDGAGGVGDGEDRHGRGSGDRKAVRGSERR